jgi:uncharacterized protein YjcR
MRPARGDGLFNTAESARLLGVSPSTIRSWRYRGWLEAQGLDERGYPLHSREALIETERLVRANGLRATRGRTDPRRLRGRGKPQALAA